MPKGKKSGGRKPGSINKRTADSEARWIELLEQFPAADEQEFLARTIACVLPCGTCHGTRRTKYLTRDNKEATRVCQSCDGTGLEKISVPDRIKAAGIVAARRWPERKAIDHTTNGQALDFNAMTPEQLERFERSAAVLGDLLDDSN